MSDYEIKCSKCNLPVTHICDENFKKTLKRLLTWVPEGMWSSGEMHEAFKAESKKQGDEYNFEEKPFFGSQAWTYLIWYKEDARSFHAILNNMIRAAGIDPYQLEQELYQERLAKEKEEREEQERRQRAIEARRQRQNKNGPSST